MATLKRIAYSLLSLPFGIVTFTLVVAGVSTGVGTAATIIGIPLLAAVAAGARYLAEGERRLLHALLGEEITAAYREPLEPGVWPLVKTRLADPQTYKDLAYQVVALPFGIAAFTLTVNLMWLLALALLIAVVWRAPLDLLVRATELLAEAQLVWARTMLGSEPDPALVARVDDLRGSQARIIDAADEARRRIERDLHDGAQQRLVSLSLKLGMARARMDGPDAVTLVAEAHEESKLALAELRDLARGIHPAILTDRGLAPALQDLADRASVPTTITEAPGRRLSRAVEGSAYFVVAEALANVAKYAPDADATVLARVEVGRLVVEVADDGPGGAVAREGSGLDGLADRVGALEGRLEVRSPPGGGTVVRAEIPTARAVAEPD